MFLNPTWSVPSAVQLDRLPEVGVPSTGVTKVGDVANTRAPEPVSSVTAAAICAEVATSVFDVRLIVLFVNVCVPVSVATVESIPIVTAADPL